MVNEYLYHVDKDDNVIGKIPRDIAHRDLLLHRAGIVLVFNSHGQIYLTKRSSYKSIFPGCIDCACSFHVAYGESYQEAAQRELKEETGLASSIDLIGKFILDDDIDRMIVVVYKTICDDTIFLSKEAENGNFYTIKETTELMKYSTATSWWQHAWNLRCQW